MAAHDERQRVADWYAAFAANEAHGQSAIYERLSVGIAASGELLDFLLTLPHPRRQPNLFLAAVRHLHGVPNDVARLTDIIRRDPEPIRALMLSRTTQTNEPARCAVLLPLLAQLPAPLALIEVGASAGLCLLPDRYGYDYGAVRIRPPDPAAPVFRCETSGAVPLPMAVPRIIWRRGLDLNPVDLQSDDEVPWLETLVWPGRNERARGLRSAIAVARLDPPTIVKGNLLTDLEPLMAMAPKDATLVVFHTAVIGYLQRDDRNRFAEAMIKSAAVWISNEAPSLFPGFAHDAPPAPAPGMFLLTLNGVPMGWTAPHGQSITWFGAA